MDQVIKIINQHEEEDGSLTLTIEAPPEVIRAWEEHYGTKDFGDALIRDCIEYAKTHKEELQQCAKELLNK